MKGLKRALRRVTVGILSCVCAVSFTACDASDVVDTVKGKVVDAYEYVKDTVLGWLSLAEEIRTYTVTFETNGGTQIAPAVYETENTYIPERPADPEKYGYDFGGWYLDGSFTVPYNFDTAFNSDVTLYACFLGQPYTVTFETNGAGEIPSQFLKENEIPVRPEDPELEGQYFIGWYLDNDSQVEYNFDYALANDCTLYAYFTDSLLITCAEDLVNIKNAPNAEYILTTDINLSGSSWTPLEKFSGVLDGNGHTIRFFAMARMEILSGFIKTNNGTIKDLTIQDIAFSSVCVQEYVSGTLVGVNNGSIQNCHIVGLTASFKSNQMRGGGENYSYVGGLVGRNEETGVVENCSVQGLVQSTAIANNISVGSAQWEYCETINNVFVGGVVCENYGVVKNVSADIELSHSSQTVVNVKGQGAIVNAYLGGLVGVNYNALGKSYFNGEITFSAEGVGKANHYVGGFVGQNYPNAAVTECCATGEIAETYGENDGVATALSVGGFVYLNAGTIDNSYTQMNISTVSVGSTGDLIGGFVAFSKNAISSSYASGNIQTSSKGIVGGFVASFDSGVISGCIVSGDRALTTAENYGAFAGNCEDGSILLKCFYQSDSVVTVDGEPYAYVETNSTLTGIAGATIYTEEVVFNQVYWSQLWTIENGKPTFPWVK